MTLLLRKAGSRLVQTTTHIMYFIIGYHAQALLFRSAPSPPPSHLGPGAVGEGAGLGLGLGLRRRLRLLLLRLRPRVDDVARAHGRVGASGLRALDGLDLHGLEEGLELGGAAHVLGVARGLGRGKADGDAKEELVLEVGLGLGLGCVHGGEEEQRGGDGGRSVC